MLALARRLWANPYLLMTMTTFLWGGNAVASRMAVDNIAPMTLTTLRWLCVAGLLPYLIRKDLLATWPAIRANAVPIILMGVFGYTGFNTLMYLAAYSTAAINIGIIQGGVPVFVLLGAFLWYRTPIRAVQALGMVLTLIGVVVIASQGDFSVLSQLGFARGDVYMIIAAGFYAAYTVALRKRPEMPPLVFFAAMSIVACLISLPLLVGELATGAGYWPTAKGWAVLAFVTIGPTFVSQLLFIRGVELLGPGRAGIFINLVPVFASFLAVLILHEPFGLYHALSLALVLGGIWLSERGKA